jgi:hypothetical protein
MGFPDHFEHSLPMPGIVFKDKDDGIRLDLLEVVHGFHWIEVVYE